LFAGQVQCLGQRSVQAEPKLHVIEFMFITAEEQKYMSGRNAIN